MYEYYDLEIEKEDFEKVVKYFLTSDEEQFKADLKEKEYSGNAEMLRFSDIKSLVKSMYEEFDYCLLDDIKYYKDLLNQHLRVYYEFMNDNSEKLEISSYDKEIVEEAYFMATMLNSLDTNEQHIYTRAWCKADKYFKGA